MIKTKLKAGVIGDLVREMKLHIGIAGPIDTEAIKLHLNADTDVAKLPIGYGGAPLIGTLIGELLARGHRVSAYTTSSDLSLDIIEPFVAEGARFKIYYCPVRKHSMGMNGKYIGRIVDFFKLERRFIELAILKDNPDVVHAHWAYEFALAAISSGKPNLVTCHDAPQQVLKYMPNLYRLGRYFMAIKAMRKAKKLTTVSPYMYDLLLPLAKKELDIIGNPLPTEVTDTLLPARYANKSISSVVIMVANGWDRRKNLKNGILGFAKLRRDKKNVILKLIGTGYEAGGVANQWVSKYGLNDGIDFLGRLPYESVLNEIGHADIFLHTSREESFGMVVAEAMALGVPVVAGKYSGAVPWIVGQDGLLVDVNDPQEISKALFTLLDNEDLRNKLRFEAKKSALSRFGVKEIVSKYEEIYRQLYTDYRDL